MPCLIGEGFSQMNSGMSMCPENWQLAWVWAQNTPFWWTKWHSIIPGHEYSFHILCSKQQWRYCIYFYLLLMAIFRGRLYIGIELVLSGQLKCGTQLESSCWLFVHSTVLFGGKVDNTVLLATIVIFKITLTRMVFLAFIKW